MFRALVDGTMRGTPRTRQAALAVELFNDVQLCHEMKWTYDELLDAPEEFVWAASKVLTLQAEKVARESKH